MNSRYRVASLSHVGPVFLVIVACGGLAQGQPAPAHLQAAQKRVEALNQKVGYKRTNLLLAREIKAREEGKVNPLTGLKIPKNFLQVALKHNLKLARPPLHKILKSVQLPARHDFLDLSNTKFHGRNYPVQDQDTCGCCWVFAAIAAYEANTILSLGTDVNAAEQHLVNCVFTLNTDGSVLSDGCAGGWPGDAFDFMQSGSGNKPAGTGDRSDPSMRYKVAKETCDPNARLVYKVVEWGYVNPNKEIPDDEEIKQAIFQYGAVAVAITAKDELKSYLGGADFVTDEPRDINHAVALVGWKTENNQVFWRLRNSWGTNWGENGYAWIKSRVSDVGYGAMWVTASKRSGPAPDGDGKFCPCPTRPMPPNYNTEIVNRINWWTTQGPARFRFPQ